MKIKIETATIKAIIIMMIITIKKKIKTNRNKELNQ